MDFVIMAAGLGSRFGGLKQLEPVDKNGNFILDYTVFDAILAGFDRIVFIVKPENFDIFKKTIGHRIENHIKVEYVFQDNLNVSKNFVILKKRDKPLGTGHAVLCAKNVVKNNFAVANADDYYGRESIFELAKFLKNNTRENEFALVGFNLFNTLSPAGSVKRGLCRAENGYLQEINEAEIFDEDSAVYAKYLTCKNENKNKIDANSLVSMNLFGFSPLIFDALESEFERFLKNADLEADEFFLPAVVDKMIKSNLASVKILSTPSKWQGLTYKSDLNDVKTYFEFLVRSEKYPKTLWE